MADKTWKRREREVAQLLGGRRIPVTGLDRAGADVETETLAVQVKHGRRRPAFLRVWLDGICQAAGPSGKAGVVVWTTQGESTRDAVVVLRLDDFAAFHETDQASSSFVAEMFGHTRENRSNA